MVKIFFNTIERATRAQHRSPIAVASEPIHCEQAPAKAFWLRHPGDIDATSATPAHHWASPGLDPQRHEGPAPKTGHHDGSDMPSSARCPSANPLPHFIPASTGVLAMKVGVRQAVLSRLIERRAAMDRSPIKGARNLLKAWLHWGKDDGSSTPLSGFSP